LGGGCHAASPVTLIQQIFRFENQRKRKIQFCIPAAVGLIIQPILAPGAMF
jgi:hypothetical protein